MRAAATAQTATAAGMAATQTGASATAMNRALEQSIAPRGARYRQAKATLKAAERQVTPVDAFGNRKPRLRGWQHLITLPLCIAASIVLICIAPAGPVKAACAIYGASAILLFGNSALLHVVPWRSAKVTRVLCGIDYSNIFLIIAGTNTPVLVRAQPFDPMAVPDGDMGGGARRHGDAYRMAASAELGVHRRVRGAGAGAGHTASGRCGPRPRWVRRRPC